MSYEQLSEFDPLAPSEAVPSKQSLTLENSSRNYARNAPLVNLNDLRNYARTDNYKNKSLRQDLKFSSIPIIPTTAKQVENATLSAAASSSRTIIFSRPGFGKDQSKEESILTSSSAEGKGEPGVTIAYGSSTSLLLEGKTVATFDGGSYSVAGLKMKDSDECICTDDKCVKATGVLKAKYSVKTRVTLPSVSQYPDLTLAQKKRLQSEITNVLAPHEQEHVVAFNKYGGSTSTPFSLSLCKGKFDGTIQSMFDTEEASRRQDAQAESDSLDPFFFEFEL